MIFCPSITKVVVLPFESLTKVMSLLGAVVL